MRTRGPQRGVFHRDAPRIFPALERDDRNEFVRLVEVALRDDNPQRRTYGTWLTIWMSRSLTPKETTLLARAIAQEISRGSGEIVTELERRLRGAAPYTFRKVLLEHLEEVEAETAEAEAELQAARELLETPKLQVRRIRSVDERPS
jgi:hypothetical protein